MQNPLSVPEINEFHLPYCLAVYSSKKGWVNEKNFTNFIFLFSLLKANGPVQTSLKSSEIFC